MRTFSVIWNTGAAFDTIEGEETAPFGPYIEGEFADIQYGLGREVELIHLHPLLTEDQVRERFPEALAAWRAGNDSAGQLAEKRHDDHHPPVDPGVFEAQAGHLLAQREAEEGAHTAQERAGTRWLDFDS